MTACGSLARELLFLAGTHCEDKGTGESYVPRRNLRSFSFVAVEKVYSRDSDA